MVMLGILLLENYGNITLVIWHQRTLIQTVHDNFRYRGPIVSQSHRTHAAAAMNAAADTETDKLINYDIGR